MPETNNPNYTLDENGHFVIEAYQSGKPFSSFLPGIAGPMGIPLWAFYVNRGQAIASFGVENKDKPILEYQPANRAYQLTPFLGFRTFLRLQRENHLILYEPFSITTLPQKMTIGANDLTLQEINQDLGVKTEVVYFLLPGESISGLVRIVTITNLTNHATGLEILDGLPALIPYGVTNQMLKDLGRTVEAWMEVENLQQKIPFYRLRASVADSNEVSSYEAGHYMLAFTDRPNGSKMLQAIVDPFLVFGQNTSLAYPDPFYRAGLNGVLDQVQITCSRTPSGFSALQAELDPGRSIRVNSIFGHVSRLDDIQSKVDYLTSSATLDRKRFEANALVTDLTETIACQTGSPIFDAYCRQTFLDNVLRGGWPLVFGTGNKKRVYHIYSRKHGDLERDYNAFNFSPEFYSQGNGSYRDVNQNRREDIWFNPAIGDFDIRTFMSLIQLDGYNPLVVKGSRFTISPEKINRLLPLASDPGALCRKLTEPFTPGSLLKWISDQAIKLKVDEQEFLEKVMWESDQHIQADFGEGYWVDHWTYNLDLIERYLAIYPEFQNDLLFSNADLPFYDSPVIVRPRSEKYVLFNGQPRQLGSVIVDPKKVRLIAKRTENPNWARTQHGEGEIYRCTLFAKLFGLVLIKFATLDPYGMGIEMEAGRPGWYDAMNGLPSMFGASMPETYSLLQLIKFLRRTIIGRSDSLRLPVEMFQLVHRIEKSLKKYYASIDDTRDHDHWEAVSSAREAYRAKIRLGIAGAEENLPYMEVDTILQSFERKITDGIVRANSLNGDMPPTFFYFSVEEYEILIDKKGLLQLDPQGRPIISVRRFSLHALPMFLEGMVRAMRSADYAEARSLYKKVKLSPLYDAKLKMYKVNAALGAFPIDIGRVRAFTPGWLENESIWLHMEYKYLLEILRAGLYTQFFEDFKHVLVPFMDPRIYGRSTLENSSFLVSSSHPDQKLHGVGFVARLSGATAEFLSIWTHMLVGSQLFTVQNGALALSLKPILPGWLFDDRNTISFKFLGRTPFVYHNPDRRDTFDPNVSIRSIMLKPFDGESLELRQETIPAPYSTQIREGRIKQIDGYIS